MKFEADDNGWTKMCVRHELPARYWAGHIHVNGKKLTCGWCSEKCGRDAPKVLPGLTKHGVGRCAGCFGEVKSNG